MVINKTLLKFKNQLKNNIYNKNNMCNCGCNTCETKGPLLTEGKVKSLLSEGLQYHIDKQIPLFETVYRIGSDKHLSLIKEARKMYSRNIIDLCEDDEALIKTHLGEFALYEGESVPLDLPMLNESTFTDPNTGKSYDLQFISSKNRWELDVMKKGASFLDSNAITTIKRKTIEEIIDWLEGYNIDSSWIKESLNEAKKKEKKDPPLNKPKRGGSKAYYVYVRDPKTKKIKKVSFGSGGLRAKIKNKKARNAFAARHNCKNKKDRTKAGYWSCNLPRYAPALGLGAKMNTFW